MSQPNRPKRPELDRSEPIRGVGGLFGPPRQADGQTGAETTNGKGVSSSDGVSRGVDIGYRVIEEYMRQGQSFARTVWSPRFSQETFGADPAKLATRMYQYASDLGGAWLEYLQVTMAQVPSAPSPKPGTHIPGFGIGSNGAAKPADLPTSPAQSGAEETRFTTGHERAAIPAVSVQIASKKRTEVTVDMKPGALDGSLTAFDLRARDAAVPRIATVSAEASKAENRVTVKIDVSDDQPVGIYTGLIVDDASNLPRGTLTVRVLE